MARRIAPCLAFLVAALASGPSRAAAEIPPELRQRLASIESEEEAEHYVTAYLHLMDVKKAATESRQEAALERIDELEGYLATMAKQETMSHLQKYLHQQADENEALRNVLARGRPGEPVFSSECGYEADAGYVCSATIEGKQYRCAVGTGGPHYSNGSD
jgi:hypothetical protein